MKYLKSVWNVLLKGLRALFVVPMAVIYMFTAIFIGISSLFRMIVGDAGIPIRFMIENLEEKAEIELINKQKVVEEVVAPVVEVKVKKPRAPRKPKETTAIHNYIE